MEPVETLAEVARNLNVVRNKQVELLERISVLEERLEGLLTRLRPLEDRLAKVEKLTAPRAQVYSR